ncbi:ArsR/SmtB family transcription factor [Glycomyces paridis]|uniref:Helix-turn-helix transcriptional regulator n=1 Tax=Glycomyces paridis TaxID=2126555 RepID=A0A4S8P8L9_9ACTN|nr:helix-turn-helix transcriptional regulator [Glycomyces paridis]
MQQVLEALADPIRRAIVRGLYASGEDRACGTFPMVVSKSTGTHHFKVLREAGLIRQYYVGTSRMNSLRRTDIDAAFPGLLDAVAGHPEPAPGAPPPPTRRVGGGDGA